MEQVVLERFVAGLPASRRDLFQAAHYNPMAGHLGCETTQNRIMDRFYWPGHLGRRT